MKQIWLKKKFVALKAYGISAQLFWVGMVPPFKKPPNSGLE